MTNSLNSVRMLIAMSLMATPIAQLAFDENLTGSCPGTDSEEDTSNLLQARVETHTNSTKSVAAVHSADEAVKDAAVTPEPVVPLWQRTCPEFKARGRLNGPFSRFLPGRLSETLPTVEELAQHLSGPEPDAKFYDRVKASCSQNKSTLASSIPYSTQPVFSTNDAAMCLWVGQKRITRAKADTFDNDYFVGIETLLAHFGYGDATVIVQAGDHAEDINLPVFMKARKISEDGQERHDGVSVVPMNVHRHFGSDTVFAGSNKFDSHRVPFENLSLPRSQLRVCRHFREKKDRLLWRGATTGRNWTVRDTQPNGAVSDGLPDRQWLLTRWGENQSARIDVGTHKYVQNVPHRWKLKNKVSIDQMSQNKFLVLPEGNDVASASAWSLFSSSVVLMPIPRKESVVAHGLLKPWVHFIPIERNFSDLDVKMQWCLNNLDDCEDIAHRASIYMYHMWPGSKLFMMAMQRVLDTHFKRFASTIDFCCSAKDS